MSLNTMTMYTRASYNHAKFEKSNFNGVHEKANVKGFSNEKISQLSPWNMCDHKKKGYIHDRLDVLNNPMKILLDQIRT